MSSSSPLCHNFTCSQLLLSTQAWQALRWCLSQSSSLGVRWAGTRRAQAVLGFWTLNLQTKPTLKSVFKALGEAGSKALGPHRHGPAHTRGPRMVPGTPSDLQDGLTGDPSLLHCVAGLVPARCHAGLWVGPWLWGACNLKGCAEGTSHCPALGTVPRAAAASSEATPATVISVTPTPAWPKTSGSRHQQWSRLRSLCPFLGPRCTTISFPWEDQPQAPTVQGPTHRGLPSPKASPLRDRIPGTPAAPAEGDGTMFRGQRRRTRVLLPGCRG